MSEFDDIINLQRPISKKHPPMPLINRAAQFGAFRALTGYEDAIDEEARLTDSWVEIDREKTEEINRRMTIIRERIKERPSISVTHFIPDENKSGGKYEIFSGNLRVIDDTQNLLIFTDGTKIPFSAISDFVIN